MAKQLRAKVRLDKVKSAYEGHNFSIRLTEEMENGYVVKLGDLEKDNRDVHAHVKPAANDKLVLIANPALIYDQSTRNGGLEVYYFMEAGEVVRGYELQANDVYAITALAVEGTAVVDQYLVSGAGYKLVPSATPVTEGFCAKVNRFERVGGAFSLNLEQTATEYIVLEVLNN